MARAKVSDSLLQQMVNAVAEHGNEVAAARALGLPRATLHSRMHEAKARGVVPNAGFVDPNSIDVLKGTISRLEGELKRANSVSAELDVVKRVIGSVSEKVSKLDPPKWVAAPLRKASAPGVPTLFLSDLHWGEHVYASQINGVNEYSVAIAKARMHVLVDSTVHLLRIISPTLDYPGIVIPLGGDMISGNIHDELTATNELNSMPAVLDLFTVLVGVIKAMADKFGNVFLPCVSGNHGRDTMKIWNKDRHHTSFDWLLYQFLARHFEGDKRISFYIPDSSDAYYKIYDHAYLLTHGDQFRGGDGMIGCLGPILRGDHKKRSRNAQIDMDYDTMIMGHWHQYIHHGRVIVNGSLKGYDEYAYSSNFGFEPPQQALWLTHPKHHITFRMPVYVDRQREAMSTAWVSVPKS